MFVALCASCAPFPKRSSAVTSVLVSRTLEAEVGADRSLPRLFEPRIEFRLEVRHANRRGSANVQMGVERALGFIRHQNLHLALGHVLDMLIESTRLDGFDIDRPATL